MNYNVVITSLAEESLEKIIDFYLQNDISLLEIAISTVTSLRSHAKTLKNMPYKGKMTSPENINQRVLIYRDYLIFYRVYESDKTINITRFSHSKNYPSYKELF